MVQLHCAILSLPRFQGQCLESCFYTEPGCATNIKPAAHVEACMKELSIREMRASIGRLAELVEAEGELEQINSLLETT